MVFDAELFGNHLRPHHARVVFSIKGRFWSADIGQNAQRHTYDFVALLLQKQCRDGRIHATAPRPDGTTQARAINLALEEAGFDPEKDNLYINAHGTGTQLNDVAETIAYKVALGDYAYKAHISSIKSMTGHMFGAAGAAEAIATVLAVRDGIIPPTINLDCPDPECDLDYTPNVAVRSDVTIGISDSLGFGGHDACVAFRKYEG